MAKPFRVGHAAATGITCALLAKEGFTSDDTALEGRYGLLEALGPVPEEVLRSLGTDLGVEFELEREIRIKPFASCTASHAPVEAMLRLTAKHFLKPADVKLIETDLKPYPLVRQEPRRGFEGRFSMPFCLAHVLAYGRLLPNDFTDERVKDPQIQDLMNSTRHLPDSSLLTIVLKSGERLIESIAAPSDLKGWDETVAKFNGSVDKLLADDQQRKVIGSVQGLQEIDSIRCLTKALRSAERN
jgi:2-methylcitrate dehydratase PrpD